MSFDPTAVKTEVGGRTPRPPLLPWLQFALLAVAAEFLVIYVVAKVDRDGAFVGLLLPGAHLLLFPFLLRNFSLWGMRVVTVGFALNLMVMAVNGGLMPVDKDAIEAVARHDTQTLTLGDHIPRTKNVYQDQSQTRLAELSDAIILPVPPPFARAVSPGDVLVVGGIAIVAVELFTRQRQKA